MNRMELFNYKGEWSCIVCRKTEAIGDNCIKQIKTVSERQMYVFSHLYFPDFIQTHKIIHSLKVEVKLCGEQREPSGMRGTKDEHREIWGGDKFDAQHIQVNMFFKKFKNEV